MPLRRTRPHQLAATATDCMQFTLGDGRRGRTCHDDVAAALAGIQRSEVAHNSGLFVHHPAVAGVHKNAHGSVGDRRAQERTGERGPGAAQGHDRSLPITQVRCSVARSSDRVGAARAARLEPCPWAAL